MSGVFLVKTLIRLTGHPWRTCNGNNFSPPLFPMDAGENSMQQRFH